MLTTLHYGSGSKFDLQLDECIYLGPSQEDVIERGQLSDVVRTALAKPMDFPPLAACTVPGDMVVVALQRGLPMLHELVTGLRSALEDAGVERNSVRFVFETDPSSEEQSLEGWAESLGIEARIHDPDDEEHCSLVSVMQSGEPLRMNRELGEADFVLPVGLASGGAGLSANSKFAGLFPEFADGETLKRFRQVSQKQSSRAAQKCREEVDEAGWLLGVNMSLRIVPGAAGAIAEVLAGEPDKVTEVANEHYQQLWNQPITETGELVIATICGPAEEQTWDNVCQALIAAESALRPGGVIAICTQLAESPGPALQTLKSGCDSEQLQQSLGRERGTVYLSSQLAAGVVEDLGLAPIQSEQELKRLTESFSQVVVLEDAHRLICQGAET